MAANVRAWDAARDKQPPAGTQLNRAHPLAQLILRYGAANLWSRQNLNDVGAPVGPWALTGGVDSVATRDGRGVRGNGTTGLLSRSISVNAVRPQAILCVHRQVGTSTTAASHYALGSAAAGSGAFITIASGTGAAANVTATIRSTDSSINVQTATGPALVNGALYASAFLVRSIAAANNNFLVNGVSYIPVAASGNLETSGTALVHEAVGALKRGAISQYSSSTVLFTARFVPPSTEDIAALLQDWSLDPWQIFEPQRILVPVSAGGGSTSLTVADALHAHSADAQVLTSLTALTVAEALHAHSADAATLVAGSVLAVAESSHGHAADGLTLTSAHALAVADAAHGHAADNLTLTAASVLALQEALHAHAADATALTMDSALAVAETLHVQAADNPVLGVAGTTNLVVADAAHAHSADVLALTSAHALVVADAIHGHSVEGLTLSVASVLAIQEALHAHAAENLALETTGSAVLLLADSLHAHTSDGAALTVDAWLVAADAAHGHSADNVVFTFGGAIPTDTLPMMVSLQNSYMLVAPERSLMIVRV